LIWRLGTTHSCSRYSVFLMGETWFRQREIVETATRECETRRTGETRLKKQKNVNAKTSTGEVTVSGKNVKFSARTAKATLAV
jgi:hypothetical protein